MALLPQLPVQRESLYTAPISLLGMRTLLTLRPPPPPCLFSLYPPPPASSYNSSSFLSSFRPDKRFHFLAPCYALKQTKRQRSGTAPRTAPQSIRWFFSNSNSEEEGGGGDKRGRDDEEGELELEDDTAFKGTLLAGVLLVGLVGGFATAGYVYKDQINAFLSRFSTFIEGGFVKIQDLFEDASRSKQSLIPLIMIATSLLCMEVQSIEIVGMHEVQNFKGSISMGIA